MSSRLPTKESHNRLTNSSTPGLYDGNPANLPDLLRTIQTDLSLEGISSNGAVEPLRPFCMRNLPYGEYMPIEYATDPKEHSDIEKFHEKLDRFNIRQTLHLATIIKYLSPPVFEDIRPIHDNPTHPVATKITLIMDRLNTEAAAKTSITVQLIIKDIAQIPFATSFPDAITYLTTADTKYAQLADLGAPRSQSEKRQDLHRIVSQHPCFDMFNHELEGTRINASYDDLKAYLKLLNLGKMARSIHKSDSDPFPKKARIDTSSGQIYSSAAFPLNSSLGTTHQNADGSIWAMTSAPTHRMQPAPPRVYNDCWNCRSTTCPGRNSPKLCDKLYCRLCDGKNVLKPNGEKDCFWSSTSDPRYHLPHQCAFCPPRFRAKPATTTPTSHPIPYAHNKGTSVRSASQAQGYSSLLASRQLNVMTQVDNDNSPEQQEFNALMSETYPDTDADTTAN